MRIKKNTYPVRFNQDIYYVSLINENPIFHVELAGKTNSDKTYKISRGIKSSIYVFEYIISGKGTVIFNGEKHRIKANDSYIITPHIEHEYYSNPKNPWTKIWFNCSGTLIDALANVYNITGFTHLVDFSIKNQINDFHRILREHDKNMQQQLQVAIHEIFISINNFLEAHNHINPDALQLKNYIDKNFNLPIKLEDLGNLIGKSSFQVLRIFKETWHTTPYSYIQKNRLNFAKKYLENTAVTIKEIAYMLNFADEYYFSNWFKKHQGVAPSVFRNQSF